MRILVTASTFPRFSGDTEPEFILQLAEELSHHHRVTVLVPHTGGAATHEWMGQVEVVRFRYAPLRLQSLAYEGGMMTKLRAARWRWLLVPLFVLGQLLALRRILRSARFDILHSHWILPQGLVLAVAKKVGLVKVPAMLTIHGGDLYGLQGRMSTWIKSWVLQAFDCINVVSHAMAKECFRLGADDRLIWVRSMGVDLQHRFVVSRAVDERSGMVFVGRLVEKKGVEVLIQAFSMLREDFPEIELNIVGEGPLRGSLEELTVQLGCAGAIKFLGAIPNSEVPSLLNLHRIAITPSVVAADGDQEGLGLVIVEAQGCGCAVVASRIPAILDVITDGVDGMLVAPGDPSDVRRVLAQMMEDESLVSRLAAAGRESAARRFDWAQVGLDYIEKYRQIVSD